jgi:predicted dehydrogenase
MRKLIRWGIIGCGKVTEVKSGPAYTQVDNFEIVAVMRRNLALAKDYADRHHIKDYYNDADELINAANVDAVYIATPPDTHHYYALKVAEAGKVCCIEKPMAPSYVECLEINNAFQSKRIPLYVAYYRRSLPRFEKVKSLIDDNKIGEIRHISWQLSKPANEIDISKAYNWRTDSKIASGGYFDDLASHGLDLFNHLLGDIKDAFGISTNQQQLYSAKDAISATWLHNTGVTGSGFWNFGAFTREDKVEIIGSKGKIVFSVFEEEPIIFITHKEHQEFLIENPEHIQLYHVENMRKDLDGLIQHPSNGDTATNTAWVMDKILGKL